MILFAIWLALTVSISSAHPPFNTGDISERREAARQILRRSDCARCHIPPGNAKALNIYNLDRTVWIESMTPRQIEQIKWRIEESNRDIAEGIASLDHKSPLSALEIKALQAFVDKELARRRAGRPE